MYDVKRVRIVYTYTIKIRNEIIMKIVEVKSKNGINFMILDGNNEPIVDAVRYLKYLDSVSYNNCIKNLSLILLAAPNNFLTSTLVNTSSFFFGSFTFKIFFNIP